MGFLIPRSSRRTRSFITTVFGTSKISPWKKVQSFARLFMVPGMGHCSGNAGPNTFDALAPLIDWVENDNVPESIIGTGSIAGQPMSRPLCAYPKQARYTGTGLVNDAANFTCVDDGTNDPSLEIPAREYLSPLIIVASAPPALNLRSGGGLVTIAFWTPSGLGHVPSVGSERNQSRRGHQLSPARCRPTEGCMSRSLIAPICVASTAVCPTVSPSI